MWISPKYNLKWKQNHPTSIENEFRKSIALIDAKKVPCAVGGASPQTPGTLQSNKTPMEVTYTNRRYKKKHTCKKKQQRGTTICESAMGNLKKGGILKRGHTGREQSEWRIHASGAKEHRADWRRHAAWHRPPRFWGSAVSRIAFDWGRRCWARCNFEICGSRKTFSCLVLCFFLAALPLASGFRHCLVEAPVDCIFVFLFCWKLFDTNYVPASGASRHYEDPQILCWHAAIATMGWRWNGCPFEMVFHSWWL